MAPLAAQHSLTRQANYFNPDPCVSFPAHSVAEKPTHQTENLCEAKKNTPLKGFEDALEMSDILTAGSSL